MVTGDLRTGDTGCGFKWRPWASEVAIRAHQHWQFGGVVRAHPGFGADVGEIPAIFVTEGHEIGLLAHSHGFGGRA